MNVSGINGKTSTSGSPLSPILFDGTFSLNLRDLWQSLPFSLITLASVTILLISWCWRKDRATGDLKTPSSSLIFIASRLSKDRASVSKEHGVTENTAFSPQPLSTGILVETCRTSGPQRETSQADVQLQKNLPECWALQINLDTLLIAIWIHISLG